MKEKNGLRVAVGMSGGIDSSAVCMMLQEQGYEVIGVTLRMWDISSQFKTPEQEHPNHVIEAQELAQRLGIPHYALDVRDDFKATVVQNFIDEYMRGRTPNPCVMCNLMFKWRYLLDFADEHKCDFVATGHYARIEQEQDYYYIAKGVDQCKDQSYFLWRLGNRELSRTLYPLGGLTKDTIRAYVLERGYKEKVEKKESMEVCFIEKDYREFLQEHVPELAARVGGGYFVDEQGKKLGQHKGYPYYTIGQRKGLEIALGHPAYVVRINPARNTVRLGTKEDLLTRRMLVSDCRLSGEVGDKIRADVRIRYRSAAIPATIEILPEGRALVRFEQEASAITPGQSAVFYNGDRVVGGGLIADQRDLKHYKEYE